MSAASEASDGRALAGPGSSATVLADRIAAALVHHEPGWRLPRQTALARRYNVSPAEVDASIGATAARRSVPDGRFGVRRARTHCAARGQCFSSAERQYDRGAARTSPTTSSSCTATRQSMAFRSASSTSAEWRRAEYTPNSDTRSSSSSASVWAACRRSSRWMFTVSARRDASGSLVDRSRRRHARSQPGRRQSRRRPRRCLFHRQRPRRSGSISSASICRLENRPRSTRARPTLSAGTGPAARRLKWPDRSTLKC